MILNRKNHRKQGMIINSITVKDRHEVILNVGWLNINSMLSDALENALLYQAILLGNTFINNQFNYAVLIRMFCRKTMYHKIEKNYHGTLKVTYQNYWKVVRFLYIKDIWAS